MNEFVCLFVFDPLGHELTLLDGMCVVDEFACFYKLLVCGVQAVVYSGLWWKQGFSLILKGWTVQEVMFYCFLFSFAVSAVWAMVLQDSGQVYIDRAMASSVLEDCGLVFPGDEVYGVSLIWSREVFL